MANNYEELVAELRKMQSVEYCVIASSAEDFPAIKIVDEAADAIEELEYALLLMVLQYCTTDDGLLFHEFMSAGENAFAVLGLENGQQEAPLWYKMDRMMQSASERISKKTTPKEET